VNRCCADIATHNHGDQTYRDGKPVELHFTAKWRRPRAVIVHPATRRRFDVRLNRYGSVPGRTAVIGVAVQVGGRALSVLWANPVHRYVPAAGSGVTA
jgi:hypothetical protein